MKLNFFSQKGTGTLSGTFELRSNVLIIPAFHDSFLGTAINFAEVHFCTKMQYHFRGLTIKTDDFIGKIDQQLLLTTLLQNSLSILVRGNYEKLVWLQRTQFSSFCTKRYHIFGYKIETFY